MSKEIDYIFRYPIEEKDNGQQCDPLVEMIRNQLESLFNLLSLSYRGEEARVDGFRLMNEREAIHSIFPSEVDSGHFLTRLKNHMKSGSAKDPSFQIIRNAELYEPRITHIKRVLESLLSVVSLERNGKPVKIDGFRLKNLEHWLVPSAGDPAEVFDHLATRCGCRCSFCYLKGNPPFVALEQPKRTAEEEYEEACTRLKYFSPQRNQALFPTLGSPYEIFFHPYALNLLIALRKKTDRPLRISTNGNALTAEFIQKLSSLKPIYLYLSLNSSSSGRRRMIMGGEQSETAIRALPLLKNSGIPYAAVIVAWPFPSIEDMLADLRETVAYADTHDVHLVEVSLPGYSQYFSKTPLFDLDKVWSSIVAATRSLRRQIRCPLLVKPSLYEETLEEKVLNLPSIVGIVKNSPAAICGLKPGDLIISIGGLKISSRPQARDILHLYHQNRFSSVLMSLERNGKIIEAELFPERFDYPYTQQTDHHLGIIFLGAGFRPGALEALKSLVSAHRAKQILFLSSRLVKPIFEQLLKKSFLFGDVQIDVKIPKNRFFGGNIFMGDLLVVQDFIDAIRDHLERNPPPDLVIIPSSAFSLGDWRRDLAGRVYLDIERAVGIPVVLLNCEPIYD